MTDPGSAKSHWATVFGWSGAERDDPLYEEAIRLGFALAKNNWCVRCGGYAGTMEGVAQGVAAAGGTCVGITNASFDPKVANRHLAEERKAVDLFDRLRQLTEGSEMFVAQRGALGTLAEVLVVWCLAYTKTLTNISIHLIGSEWGGVLEGLRSLPLSETDFSLVCVHSNLVSFCEGLEAP